MKFLKSFVIVAILALVANCLFKKEKSPCPVLEVNEDEAEVQANEQAEAEKQADEQAEAVAAIEEAISDPVSEDTASQEA